MEATMDAYARLLAGSPIQAGKSIVIDGCFLKCDGRALVHLESHATEPIKGAILVGVGRFVVVPSPTWPDSLPPQHKTSAVPPVTPHVWKPPALTWSKNRPPVTAVRSGKLSGPPS
jgi:hypothetical protein